MSPLKMAVMWHGAAMLPRLREMPLDQVQQAANQASEINCERALHLPPDVSSKSFVVPAWGDMKLSGSQVITLMVYGLWVMQGENEQMAAPLVEAWPIKETLILCPKPKPTV